MTGIDANAHVIEYAPRTRGVSRWAYLSAGCGMGAALLAAVLTAGDLLIAKPAYRAMGAAGTAAARAAAHDYYDHIKVVAVTLFLVFIALCILGFCAGLWSMVKRRSGAWGVAGTILSAMTLVVLGVMPIG